MMRRRRATGSGWRRSSTNSRSRRAWRRRDGVRIPVETRAALHRPPGVAPGRLVRGRDRGEGGGLQPRRRSDAHRGRRSPAAVSRTPQRDGERRVGRADAAREVGRRVADRDSRVHQVAPPAIVRGVDWRPLNLAVGGRELRTALSGATRRRVGPAGSRARGRPPEPPAAAGTREGRRQDRRTRAAGCGRWGCSERLARRLRLRSARGDRRCPRRGVR